MPTDTEMTCDRTYTVKDREGHTVLIVTAHDGATVFISGLALVREIRRLCLAKASAQDAASSAQANVATLEDYVASLEQERLALRDALHDLRVNANRLVDRNLGGTYEDDVRRSLQQADVVLLTGNA